MPFETYKGTGPRTYERGQVVHTHAWQCIALRTTNESPTPYATGNPFWLSGLGDTPAWQAQQINASAVVTVLRTKWDRNGMVNRIRFHVDEIGPNITYEMGVVAEPLSAAPRYLVLMPETEMNAAGWTVWPVGGAIKLSGQLDDYVLIKRSKVTPQGFSAPWDQKNKNGNPSSKEMNHQNSGAQMRFHHTDATENNQRTNLEAVPAGAELTAGGTTWSITNVSTQGSHVRYDVNPAVRLSEDERQYSFSYGTAAPLGVVYIQDHYLANPNAWGMIGTAYDEHGALDKNQYGIDVELEGIAISDDWNVITLP